MRVKSATEAKRIMRKRFVACRRPYRALNQVLAKSPAPKDVLKVLKVWSVSGVRGDFHSRPLFIDVSVRSDPNFDTNRTDPLDYEGAKETGTC